MREIESNLIIIIKMKQIFLAMLLFFSFCTSGQTGVTKYGENISTSVNFVDIYGQIWSVPKLNINGVKVITKFEPTDIAGCKLWLEADAGITLNGSAVSGWADQSGNGNNANQSTVLYQPLFVADGGSAINNQPIIRFDGTDDWLQGTTIPNINTSSMTIFIVVKYNNTNVWAQFFSINNLSNGFWIYNQTEHTLDVKNNNNDEYTSSNTFPASVFNMVSFVKNINISAKAYINGQYKTWANYQDITQSFTNNNYIIGDYSHPYQVPFNGDIAEIIVYNQALPDSSRQAVENYLMTKY